MPDLESAREWLRTHAKRVLCPPCAKKSIPDLMEPHIVQWSCICPKCRRAWMYKIRIEQKVANRKPFWHYLKTDFDNII